MRCASHRRAHPLTKQNNDTKIHSRSMGPLLSSRNAGHRRNPIRPKIDSRQYLLRYQHRGSSRRLNPRSTMNAQQINIAIAGACGWYPTPVGNWTRNPNGIPSGENPAFGEPPNYHGDLNAMHEAEKTLTDELHNVFKRRLSFIVGYTEKEHASSLPGWRRRYVSATAPQRCEAFLRSIGKWKE